MVHGDLSKSRTKGHSILAKAAARIRRDGFDRTHVSGDTIDVKCSQCEALVIQGTPCHEHGCPNEKRGL